MSTDASRDALARAFADAADELNDSFDGVVAGYTTEQLASLPERHGVYVAKEEATGAFNSEALDALVTTQAAAVPAAEELGRDCLTVAYLPRKPDQTVCVALITTFVPALVDAIIAAASSAGYLACTTDQTASVPKIAAAIAGNMVLHFPLPVGEIDLRDRAAVDRHATSNLLSLSIGASVLTLSGDRRPLGRVAFDLVAASPTPLAPSLPS